MTATIFPVEANRHAPDRHHVVDGVDVHLADDPGPAVEGQLDERPRVVASCSGPHEVVVDHRRAVVGPHLAQDDEVLVVAIVRPSTRAMSNMSENERSERSDHDAVRRNRWSTTASPSDVVLRSEFGECRH